MSTSSWVSMIMFSWISMIMFSWVYSMIMFARLV